jgi:hypothetical protein
MSTLKGMLFNQYAGEGLTHLIEDLQKKYKPKKGRRFNHQNITYEIGRPTLSNNQIEFAISSKIPQDELKDQGKMDIYFDKIKALMDKENKKPVSIEMENIVWGTKQDSDKNREYVKLIYQYPLDDLFNNDNVIKKHQETKGNAEALKDIKGAYTGQGKVVLDMVRESIQKVVLLHMDCLMNANDKVKATLKIS